MEDITPRIFNRKAPPEASETFARHLTQHFEDALRTIPIKAKLDEETKQGTPSLVQSHMRISANSGLASASTSAFSKPKIGGLHLPKPVPSSTTTKDTAKHIVTSLQKEAAGRIECANVHLQSRASPIARMRANSFQAEFVGDVFVGDVVDSTIPILSKVEKVEVKASTSKVSDKKIKEAKKQKWKKKARMARAKRRRERRAFDDFTLGSGGHFGGNSAIIGCVLDNVEKTDFFKKITQCAGGEYHRGDRGMGSDFDPSEYGSMSSGSELYSDEYDSDEEETTYVMKEFPEANTKTKRKEKEWAKKRRGMSSRDSSLERSYDHSVDTTVPEELTASFLSTEDDRSENLPQNRNRASRLSKGVSKSATSPLRLIDGQPGSVGFVEAFIEGIENRGESLLWHQVTCAMDPTNIAMRLKKGFRSLEGNYCPPRLTWVDPRRDQNYGFDIFDIQSIDKAELLNLKNFPYAIPGRSIILRLKNSTTFIFEAGTEADAIRFVRGIRGLVARLAYDLVVGNLDSSCELLDFNLVERPKFSQHNQRLQTAGRSSFEWSRAMDDVTDQMVSKALWSQIG